jgi:hypothetical protein
VQTACALLVATLPRTVCRALCCASTPGKCCTKAYTIVQPPLGVGQLKIAASCISGFTWSMHDSRSHACFTLFVCDVLGSLQVSRCVELCQLLSGANALGVAATKVQQACSKDNQQDEVSGASYAPAYM